MFEPTGPSCDAETLTVSASIVIVTFSLALEAVTPDIAFNSVFKAEAIVEAVSLADISISRPV